MTTEELLFTFVVQDAAGLASTAAESDFCVGNGDGDDDDGDAFSGGVGAVIVGVSQLALHSIVW